MIGLALEVLHILPDELAERLDRGRGSAALAEIQAYYLLQREDEEARAEEERLKKGRREDGGDSSFNRG